MKRKGFALIELLAVIVIMGILMFAAIPAINRTIENARKDQFVNLAQNYARALETLWYADGLECKSGAGTSYQVASALPMNKWYYVKVDTTDSSTIQLLQQGGKSPWGNKDIYGYVSVTIRSGYNKAEFYVVLDDESHFIIDFQESDTYEKITRTHVTTSPDWDYRNIDLSNYECRMI